MAAGQAAFSVAADVAVLDAVAAELAVQELDRGALHAAQLRTLLRMHAVGHAAGMELSTVPHAALALGCSEHRATRLLMDALGLAELPGALEALACGLLTVEQATTVVQQLAPLPPSSRLGVWRRLQQRLVADADHAVALPPARLAELLRRWVVQADPADAVERRAQAEAGRSLDHRRRQDGLVDLFACGFTGPDAQAVLSRVRARSAPVGLGDDRTADQRRFDAFKDLLLGRDPLPLGDPHDATDGCACAVRPGGGGRAACGCWPGAVVPCGAELLVHLTVDTGFGTSDEPAELVGHGPLEPDLLEQLLLAAPRLRAVWTDERNVPVAVGDRVVLPERGNAASVRRVLLELAALPPPPLLHPRHPDDHVHGHAVSPPPRGGAVPAVLDHPAPDKAVEARATGAHPADSPRGYRLPRRLRRLIDVRSPRCEWPGCGARAVRCDAEHDTAWPLGPTCACNLGPCCRRHHRVKQLGWHKTRGDDAGVAWTSPGRGRQWLSPAQHEAPTPATRRLSPPHAPHPLDDLSPLEQERELWLLAGRPDDLDAFELRADEVGAGERRDVVGEHLRTGDTTWTLDLDDPYLWQDLEPLDA